jgi:hypothetical protein
LCICLIGSNLFNSALITAGSFGIYDLGNPSKVGQYTHSPGHHQNFVRREITVTHDLLLTHLFLRIFLNNKSSSNSQVAINSLYLSINSILAIGFASLYFQ